MTFLMQLQPGFLGMAHFTEPHHRTHDLTYGFLFTTAVVGILAQLQRPSKNVAGMLMALIPWVGLVLAAVLSTDADVIRSAERIFVAAGTVVAALLHPARRDFFRSFSGSRVNWAMLTLVIVAAVPLLAFASTNIELQRTVANDHAALGHYGFMAAFSITVIGVGLLASLRPTGWRLTAWVAGLLPALFGLASVVYPDVESSLGLVWALAAIAWGVVFVAAAELSKDAESPKLLGSLLGPRGGISKHDTRVDPTANRPPEKLPRQPPGATREDTHLADVLSYHETSPRGHIGPPRLYDTFANVLFLGRRRATFQSLIAAAGVQPGQRVLDVGCGTGYFAGLLAQAVGPEGRVVGIDPSPEMITYTSRQVGRAGNCQFHVGTAESLEFPAEHFDVVVSSLVMHHLPENLQMPALREMRRVLRPGGRLLVADAQVHSHSRGWRLLAVITGLGRMARAVPRLELLAALAEFAEVRTGEAPPWLRYVHAVKAASAM